MQITIAGINLISISLYLTIDYKEERSMLTMDQIHDIRFRFFVKGESISQIATALHLNWRTVQKYVDMTDFNEPTPKPASDLRFARSLIRTSLQLTDGLKRINRHHVNSSIPPKGYLTA